MYFLFFKSMLSSLFQKNHQIVLFNQHHFNRSKQKNQDRYATKKYTHTPHRMQSFVFLCRSLCVFVAIQFSTLLKVWWKFAVAILYSMPDYPYLWTLYQMDECFVYAFTHWKKKIKRCYAHNLASIRISFGGKNNTLAKASIILYKITTTTSITSEMCATLQ